MRGWRGRQGSRSWWSPCQGAVDVGLVPRWGGEERVGARRPGGHPTHTLARRGQPASDAPHTEGDPRDFGRVRVGRRRGKWAPAVSRYGLANLKWVAPGAHTVFASSGEELLEHPGARVHLAALES